METVTHALRIFLQISFPEHNSKTVKVSQPNLPHILSKKARFY